MTPTATAHDAPAGLCWECGYPLQGLPTPRCPECGREFDPADPATMNMGRHVGGFARRLLGPPGWPIYTLTGFAALVSIWAAASPTPSGQIAVWLGYVWNRATLTAWPHILDEFTRIEVRYAYAVLAWFAVALVWLTRRVARGLTVRRIAPGQRAAPFAYWRRWLIPHVLLALTILFCLTPGPIYLGFWASYASMEATRQRTPDVRWQPPRGMLRGEKRWIGAYPLDGRNAVFGRSGVFYIGTSDLGGFVYSPVPESYRGDDLRYMGGGWYSVYRADVYR